MIIALASVMACVAVYVVENAISRQREKKAYHLGVMDGTLNTIVALGDQKK